MKDCHKLQLAIYALLLKPKEDVIIIFKGEKEAKMACKEFAEETCKSYPKCEGCGAHCSANKNLTKIIERPGLKKGTAIYVRDDETWPKHSITKGPFNSYEYMQGPLVDRLHEFEKLGYEPEDLKRIIERHHEMNGYSRDAVPVDMKKMFDTIDSVNEFFVKKIMEKPALTWPTTSSSIKDDEFVKKVKEAMKSFNLDEGPKLYVTENWKPVEIKWPKINYADTVKYDIDFTKNMLERRNKTDMTITKNPQYLRYTKFKIERVLFNNPATIVFWADGDKTVVKAQNGEPYDPEKGLAMAISKKALGNGRGYYDEFTKQLGRGQKHSTPEQFNSEVCHIQKLEDLKAAEEDNKTNRALAADALDYLKKAFINPKSTKADLMHGMAKAIECMNAILDNY